MPGSKGFTVALTTIQLIWVTLIWILFSKRKKRQPMHYHLLLRWYSELEVGNPLREPTVFIENRDRLQTIEMLRNCFRTITSRSTAPL